MRIPRRVPESFLLRSEMGGSLLPAATALADSHLVIQMPLARRLI
jgi:hypothetical protein